MTSIAFDESGDIYFDADGCLATLDGCDEILQCIKQNIFAINIENFIGQGINIDNLGDLIKAAVLDTDGVISLIQFSISSDPLSCAFVNGININFQALTVCGLVSLGS